MSVRIKTTYSRRRRLAVVALLFGAACAQVHDVGSAQQASPTPSPTSTGLSGAPEDTTFPPAVYVAKVKSILTSLPATDDEVAAVQANPNALLALVQNWMAQPAYQQNMQSFFGQAFQQSLAHAGDYASMGVTPNMGDSNSANALLRNLSESFARTAVWFAQTGRPFNSLMNTTEFMMTSALATYYAALDNLALLPNGAWVDALAQDPDFAFQVQSANGPVPPDVSANPQDPDFMVWYNPNILLNPSGGPNDVSCATTDPFVFNAANALPYNRGGTFTGNLFRLLTGGALVFAGDNETCQAGLVGTSVLNLNDYTDWRPITIQKVAPGSSVTPFYDVPALRQIDTLVLRLPRVSFFTTPAFMGQWVSNPSNQARVTANQTMITALNRAFDGSTAATDGMDMRALDANHARGECYSCHQTMDPMRQMFLRDYTFTFSVQTDSNYTTLPGWFDFGPVSQPGADLFALGAALAEHPYVGPAWAQKLCTYANNAPCNTQDPAFLSIVDHFESSGYRWNTLVEELFTSSLVTFAASANDGSSAPPGPMQGGVPGPAGRPGSQSPSGHGGIQNEQDGQLGQNVVSIARRYQLCARFSNAFNIADICSLEPDTVQPEALQTLASLATALPADVYSRGSVAPPLVTQPDLFYRGNVEQICTTLAAYLINDSSESFYNADQPNAAIAQFVTRVMALPAGEGAMPLSLLQDHYSAALAASNDAVAALQSTFVVACISPQSIGAGVSF